jgi:hypothetical protein
MSALPMKTVHFAAAGALALAAIVAMLPSAPLAAQPLPDDAMRAALEESKASGKGLTFHVRGTTIGGAVTAIGARFVTVKNQAGIAVIRVDSIDAVAGAITLK